MSRKLPKVVLYQAATADGRLALSPQVLLMADDRWPTHSDGGYAGVLDRHHPDVLLEGSGSFVLPGAGPIQENPATTPHTFPGLAGEVGVGSGHFLPKDVVAEAKRWFAVTDSRGRVRWQFKTLPDPDWAGTHLLVLASRTTPPHYLAFLRTEQIPYLVVGQDRVDLAHALETMRAVLNVNAVVATCGAHLGGALLRTGLLDEVEIEVLPILAGGVQTPHMLSCADLGPHEPATAMRLLEAIPRPDGRVLLRYAVVQRCFE